MLISMNWIRDFVDLSGLDTDALIHRFTLSTAEVEEVYRYGADTHGVIVARIDAVEKHPASKKLHLLKVNDGTRLVDCVCGAPNVRVGMRVAFATEGAQVCGQPIARAKIAGYDSCGMCCSEQELGISADHSGLMEITDDIPLGTDIKSVYGIEDTVFEVDNKSLTNRPDLWGHYGIAREFATLSDRPLRPVPVQDTSVYDALPPVPISVEDPELCYRYTGIQAENITRHVSPVNMRIRLFYCGSRAINLLADLTNYVMLELGQPMHAFDLRRVDAVEVKRFPAPFRFRTLDGNDREIQPETLMICSHGEPVGIAGVMGGLSSEIEDDTTSLLLESACFNAVSIRKTESLLGMRTDASMRYEKFLDPESTPLCAARFLYLLAEADPGARVISRLSDCYMRRFDPITISFDQAYMDRYTGIRISQQQIVKTLTSLGFGVTTEGDSYTVRVPSFRATKDVTIKADLVEEVTRIYGYDNFAIQTTHSALRPVPYSIPNSDANRTKDLLVSRYALHEIHSYIWSDKAALSDLGIVPEENLRILNAGTPDHDTLRRSMVPTLLTVAAKNKTFADRYGIFEIGRTVEGLREDRMANERRKLGILLWDRTGEEEALYLHLRDILSDLLQLLRHRTASYAVGQGIAYGWQHPVNTAALVADGETIGFLSVLHPRVKARLDRKAAVAVAEIDMDRLAGISALPLAYSEPSRLPGIDIDLTMQTDVASLDFPQTEARIRKAGGEWLRSVTVADVYEGENGSSITFRLAFVSHDKTLTKSEIQPAVDAVLKALTAQGMVHKTL